jgi:F0F1-type ATP synthase membrane subunit b/b'
MCNCTGGITVEWENVPDNSLSTGVIIAIVAACIIVLIMWRYIIKCCRRVFKRRQQYEY